MSRISKTKSKFRTIIYEHILNNKREYLIVIILFFIGLFIGVLFVNNSSDKQLEEISIYLNDLVGNMQEYKTSDLVRLLRQTLLTNTIIVVILWFGASTIIGIPVVYGTVLARGFTLGYTISSIIYTFGFINGLIINLSSLFLHNIFSIPTIFAIAVSGVKLYKSIMKNKQTDNIKLEILRHTVFCFIMLMLMILSSLIEVYISTNISIVLLKCIKI